MGWFCRSIFNYLQHPHPVFLCIRCNSFYVKCNPFVEHWDSPFLLLPCSFKHLSHAQADCYSTVTRCHSTVSIVEKHPGYLIDVPPFMFNLLRFRL